MDIKVDATVTVEVGEFSAEISLDEAKELHRRLGEAIGSLPTVPLPPAVEEFRRRFSQEVARRERDGRWPVTTTERVYL